MELAAGAVAHELPHHREAGLFAVSLDRVADVADAVAGLGLGDAQVEGFLGDIQQALGLQVHLAHRVGAGVVSVETVHLGAGVNADNVAGADDDVVGGDAVDHGVVQADAGRTGETVEPLEIGGAAVLDNELIDELVQLPGRHAGLDVLAAVLQGSGAQGVGPAHALQFFCVLDLNQSLCLQSFHDFGRRSLNG